MQCNPSWSGSGFGCSHTHKCGQVLRDTFSIKAGHLINIVCGLAGTAGAGSKVYLVLNAIEGTLWYIVTVWLIFVLIGCSLWWVAQPQLPGICAFTKHGQCGSQKKWLC